MGKGIPDILLETETLAKISQMSETADNQLLNANVVYYLSLPYLGLDIAGVVRLVRYMSVCVCVLCGLW